MLTTKRFTGRNSQSQKSQKLSLIFRKVEFNSDSYLVIEHSATHGFWSTFSICFLWQVSVEDHKVHSARASQSHHNLPSSDAPMMGHNLRADIINPMAGQPTPLTPLLGRIISVDLSGYSNNRGDRCRPLQVRVVSDPFHSRPFGSGPTSLEFVSNFPWENGFLWGSSQAVSKWLGSPPIL